MDRRTRRRWTTRRCLRRSSRRSRVASTPSLVSRSERRVDRIRRRADRGLRVGRARRGADRRLVVRRSRVSLGDDRNWRSIIPILLLLIALEVFAAGWPALRRVRLGTSSLERLGRGQGKVRRGAGGVRNDRVVDHRADHRDAARGGRCDLSLRIRAALASTAGRVSRRSARGDSERRLRALGRARPAAVSSRVTSCRS